MGRFIYQNVQNKILRNFFLMNDGLHNLLKKIYSKKDIFLEKFCIALYFFDQNLIF